MKAKARTSRDRWVVRRAEDAPFDNPIWTAAKLEARSGKVLAERRFVSLAQAIRFRDRAQREGL